MGTVYYDTGDILVTSERVAYQSVSVPLAGVTAARVETTHERYSETRLGPDRPLRWWHVAIIELAIVGVGYVGVYHTGTALPPPARFMLQCMVAGIVLTGAVALPFIAWAARPHDVRRRVVPWHHVVLTDGGREVVLFRTHHRRKAAGIVEAINRAVASRT